MSCEHADLDGSYVIGALPPTERLAFEQHLAGCADCARSVRELAGLPGLLARVDQDVLAHPPRDEPVPDTLLPALLHDVRRTRRRRSLMTVGLAAAAVTIAVGVPLAVSARVGEHVVSPSSGVSVGSQARSAGRAMTPLGDAPVRARLSLSQVGWGTRLDLTCTYAAVAERYHLPPEVTYSLFVRTRNGRTEEVGTWRALRGRTMRLTAATAATRRDIVSVEVRTPKGRPVLELTA